jgi:UDP-N-acetyl-2-amino-2-deoxyglucuronate dehydrogenase
MANFALIGAAGYIAPRHIKAIADTGNNLVAAYDKFDSVGRLDASFPECSFFTEQEQFERFVDKVKGTKDQIDWLAICTPNYTHDAFIRYGLKNGMNVICEKPVVIHPKNIVEIMKLEEETGHQVYNILQLRLHDSIVALKQKIEAGPKDKMYNIDLTYITSRGKWYYTSWKGNNHKSGGVATNIGVIIVSNGDYVGGAIHTITVAKVNEHGSVNQILNYEIKVGSDFAVLNYDSKSGKYSTEVDPYSYNEFELLHYQLEQYILGQSGGIAGATNDAVNFGINKIRDDARKIADKLGVDLNASSHNRNYSRTSYFNNGGNSGNSELYNHQSSNVSKNTTLEELELD